MREPKTYGSGATETFESVIRANCQAYYENTGTLPELVRTSEGGRFSDHIGEEVAFTLRDGEKVTVYIIGGEDSVWTQTVGLFCFHHNERYDPAEHAIYCIDCGEFLVYAEERETRDKQHIWLKKDGTEQLVPLSK